MDVLKILGIILSILIVVTIINAYNEYLTNLFNEGIFNFSKVLVAVLGEGLILYAFFSKDELRSDNYITLVAISLIIAIALLIKNIKDFSFLHGILVTLIQICIAFIIIILIILFLSSSERKKRRRRKYN